MKKFIIGFLTASLMFGGIAYGAGGKMIEVFYNVKDIKINKVSKMPEQKPFSVNGTTYVPLRFVAEELGQPVQWNSATQTIHIGETETAKAVYPGNGITHMNFQRNGFSFTDEKFKIEYNSPEKLSDNIGNEYGNYIFLGGGYGAKEKYALLEFPLNGQFTSFKANLGLTAAAKVMEEEINFKILLDDQVAYEKKMKPGAMPEKIDISTKNAIKIGFQLETTNFEKGEIGLFDAHFLK